jgi:predicted O-linked N-acetylglucosamine transferase (SPINDLY family)
MEAFSSLWMGVPVVTLAGPSGYARHAASLLQAVGLDDLVAEDAGEYVAAATKLAADRAALARLRESLRATVAASGLCDVRDFAARLEAAYRSMWRERCARYGEPREPGVRAG